MATTGHGGQAVSAPTRRTAGKNVIWLWLRTDSVHAGVRMCDWAGRVKMGPGSMVIAAYTCACRLKVAAA
eukprot:360331-Chlamydomonas_euryale.AAC.4